MSSVAWGHQPSNHSKIESKIPAAGHTRYVKYVPVGYSDTHSIAVGYLFWLFGFTGAHRFFYGKTLTGVLWFFTFGLLGVGWVIDFFLIPSMNQEACSRFAPGDTDYNLAWILLVFAGVFGIHRFVQGRWVTGIIYFMTFGLMGIGVVYDILTLNDQLNEQHRVRYASFAG